MKQLEGQGLCADRIVPIEHVRRLNEAGEDLSATNLLRGSVGASEGLSALGLAFLVPTEFWESQVLRSLPSVRPGMFIVAYCPLNIRSAAKRLSPSVLGVPPGMCLKALQNFVVYHELGHYFVDPSIEIDDTRFHDAFASYLAYGALKDDASRDVAQTFTVLFQTPEYGYYLLLNNYDKTKEIIKMALNGDRKKALERFYTEVVEQPFSEMRGRKLRVMGDIVGWPGFGAHDISVACGGEIVGVAGMRSGMVFARKVRIIDGYLPDSVRIFANEIGTMSRMAGRMNVVQLIPRGRLDIGELVRKGLSFDDLKVACETGQRPSGHDSLGRTRRYNVCYPCRCGVLIITDELTEDPEATQIKSRRRECDVCHFEFEYDGNQLVYLSIDSKGNPDWLSSNGSPDLERLILKTERWLDTNKPSQIKERLGWPDLPSFST